MSELKLKEFLHYYWGYEDFRSPQQEIVTNILDGKDTVALLPTGAGKSICYQLPAVLCEGVCIVISPLLALIKDQVTQLMQRGISVGFISSEQTLEQQYKVFDQLRAKELKLLYIAPERLQNRDFLQIIMEIEISFLAVDEAHCISEWGNDFRPSYQNIYQFRDYLTEFHGSAVPCIALTATATPKVLEEIIEKLQLDNPQVFKKSFERPNLELNLYRTENKIGHIEQVLKNNPGSGIIYCRTRAETFSLFKALKERNFDVDYYHAGLTNSEKIKKQKSWTMSNSKVLISTNAFGMGIDKENVRLVIHYSLPYSLENYYQEVGRAGRDGILSQAYLFWNENEFSDAYTALMNTIPTKSEFEKIVLYLYSAFSVAPNELPETSFEFDFTKFQKSLKLHKNKIINTLDFLNNSNCIFWKSDISDSVLKFNFPPSFLDKNTFGKDTFLLERISRIVNGVFSHEVKFREKKLATYLSIPSEMLHELLQKYNQRNELLYINGNNQRIKFLQPRNDKLCFSKAWNTFRQIQQNRIQKFKELEFFVQTNKYCRMRLILGYFGEKSTKNCGHCDVCTHKTKEETNTSAEIIKFITQKPRNIEEIIQEFRHQETEKLMDELQELLSEEKIKMLNFNTYYIE